MPQPSDDRHDRVCELFLEVCSLPAAEQGAHLDQCCDGDVDLRAEVEELLRHDSVAPELEPVSGTVWDGVVSELRSTPEDTPETLGQFRILAVLGEGGMGIVYRARQASPEREVALKVMRGGLSKAELQRRFEAEARLLGRLRHPGIAQIYEVGLATRGGQQQPFFAMELVEGRPITDFAETESLDLRERLILLARVCDAVQHAHDRGVIHRDLKPSNMLVEASGRPKVLDFGVGRATDPAPGETLLTRTGQLVGTLAYMSPEQVEGEADERADVYALGAIAYELLTGRAPLPLTGLPIPEAARRIVEDEPTPLGQIDRELRGDVETIVAKALAKERDRRYPSAAALARDLERHLGFEPIEARPASTIYQLSRLARRHRAIFAGGAIAIAALLVGLVTALTQVQAARSSLRESNATVDFLADLLSAVDPAIMGREVRVSDALEVATQRLDELGEQPRIEARLREAIGRAWLELAEPRAYEHLEQAIAAYTELYGRDDRRTLSSLDRLAIAATRDDRFELAEELAREAYELSRARYGADDRTTLDAQLTLAEVLRSSGDFQVALTALRQALAARERAGLGEDTQTLLGRQSLADHLLAMGETEEAIAELERIAAEAERRHGPENGRTLSLKINLVRAIKPFDHAGAVELAQDLLKPTERVFGPNHRTTLELRSLMISARMERSDFDGLEEEILTLIEASEATYGAEHRVTVNARRNLYFYFHRTQQLERAERAIDELVDLTRERYGMSHQTTMESLADQAGLYTEVGRLDEAWAIFEQLSPWIAALPPESQLRSDVDASKLNMLRSSGRFDEAEPVALGLVDRLESIYGPNNRDLLFARRQLAGVRQGQGRFDEAEAIFGDVIAGLEALDGADSPHVIVTAEALASVYMRQTRARDAFELMTEMRLRAVRGLGEDSPVVTRIDGHLEIIGRYVEED